MGRTGNLIFLGILLCINLACDPESAFSKPVEATKYSATLLPSEVRLRPGQSVTFTFAAVESPVTPIWLSSDRLEWILEGVPGYSVGTVTGIPAPPVATSRNGRFDAVPSLPEGVTQGQFTLRTKIIGGFNGQVVQATSKITLDVNAPLATEPVAVQEGVVP